MPVVRLHSLVARFSACFVLSAVVGAIVGCGGGGSIGGGGGGQQSSPDFTLSLSSNNLAITGGGTALFTASVTGSNGFDSAVTLQISGLPAGVTYSPASLQVYPGTPLQITFTAVSSIAASTDNLTVTGASGSLSHAAQMNLTVTVAPLDASLSSTRYRRTDAATEYFAELNESWMVYDSVTNRFFVSDPGGNRIEVMDAAAEAEIATIPVPGAYGIDESPDHSVLYAATEIGDVYAINPVTMQVTHRYLATQIGPNGFYASSVRVLANGELALLGYPGGYQSNTLGYASGYESVGIWNPANNSMMVYSGSTSFCSTSIGAFTLTGDRSLIVVTSSPARVPALCTLNPVTGQQNSLSTGLGSLEHVIPTPDGKSLLMPIFGNVEVLNAQTLAQTAIFPVAGDTSSAASMIVSPDSKTLYMGDGVGLLYAYDIASGAQIGWMPNLTVEPITAGSAFGAVGNPNLQAQDSAGLLAGPMEEGVGFLDTAAMKTGPVGFGFLNHNLSPETGPATGGTQIDFGNLSRAEPVASVYFGGKAATSISQSSGDFYATTPAGSPGTVDVYALMANGGVLIAPEGFSYGPTLLEVTPGSATAEGGGTGIVYGYGFGPTAINSPVPSDLQITIGGKPATITGYAANAYEIGDPPLPLEAAFYTIPPGTAGTSADVTVTTQYGTATASSALQYMPAVQQFPLLGASLAQGIYDARRDLYYFTDASEVRVFSRTQGQWLGPIQVPAAPSGTTHRLWGIALSQDGSKLAVSDTGTAMIYLINPDSPGSVQSFPVSTYAAGSPTSYPGVTTYPAGLAISDAGIIYFAAFISGGSGYDGFFKLDTNTGHVTDYNYQALGVGGAMSRVALSSDNSRAFFNSDGTVFSVDTETDTVTFAIDGPQCCYGDFDLTLSPGQTTLEATSYLYDTSLNAESYLVLSDRDALNISYVYGTKLSPDGTLLFQPSTNGIDVYDGRLGTLRTRISLPFALSDNFDALVSDGTDNVLIVITGQSGNGIAIVDLSSLVEPAHLSYLRAQAPSDSATLQGNDAAIGRSNLQRDTIIQAVRHIPIAVIKHTAKGVLLNKGGAVTRSKPAN